MADSQHPSMASAVKLEIWPAEKLCKREVQARTLGSLPIPTHLFPCEKTGAQDGCNR